MSTRRHVIVFQTRFAPMIRSGRKRQTIRPHRKRPIRAEDILDLRCWSGKPYRSKQQKLLETVCLSVTPITIENDFADEDMAWLDGFDTTAEMHAWFQGMHGLPFTGEVIQWW